MKKWVYLYSEVKEVEAYVGYNWDGVRGLLGGKGANLADMARIGVPIPPGFTMTTEACNAYLAGGNKFPEKLWDQVLAALKEVEKQSGKKFGDPSNPLLVSCRSGAKFSMPGMMDTILDIGLNDDTALGMVKLTNNERFVYDSYRRFVQMFGSVVLGVDDEYFEIVLVEYKDKVGVKMDTDLKTDQLKELTGIFKKIVREQKGFDFPDDPMEQIHHATEAVFSSWNGKRAKDYRRAANIADDLGTAVNIGTIVFGNLGEDSGTGVAFTRNPVTGERKLYGEYLLNAQGEDIVAGFCNTEKIEKLGIVMPELYKQFLEICNKLEYYHKEMIDIEFTIERKKLWIQNTRIGKRTSKANLHINIDLSEEGLISEVEVISRLSFQDLHTYFVKELPPNVEYEPLCFGVNASPGVGKGKLVFSANKAVELSKRGEKIVLILPFIKPDDMEGLIKSEAVITNEGGATSHAAVAARQFGIPAVVGCSSMKINFKGYKIVSISQSVENFFEGDVFTVDGSNGKVYSRDIPLIIPKTSDNPYLIKLAKIVWNLDSNLFLDNGLGKLWVFRDTLRDSEIPYYLNNRNPNSKTVISRHKTHQADGICFRCPDKKTIQKIVDSLNKVDDDDTKYVFFGIIFSFLRLLQDELGIGNHHKYFRPLIDPENTIIGSHKYANFNIDYEIPIGPKIIQLVGLEFFGINSYLKNYLEYESFQFWFALSIVDDDQPIWSLNKINPNGEQIIINDINYLSKILLVRNGRVVNINEMYLIYEQLRDRELGWDWYKKNNISWPEVKTIIKNIIDGGFVEDSNIDLLSQIDLLDKKGSVTLPGLSLISEHNAVDRRENIYFLEDYNE
jgi:phosphohistidine swiveling domain-containing protein